MQRSAIRAAATAAARSAAAAGTTSAAPAASLAAATAAAAARSNNAAAAAAAAAASASLQQQLPQRGLAAAAKKAPSPEEAAFVKELEAAAAAGGSGIAGVVEKWNQTRFQPAKGEHLLFDELSQLQSLVTEAGGATTPEAFLELAAKDPRVQKSISRVRELEKALLGKTAEARAEQLLTKPPVRVTVTGASGAIGYAALFRIASGQMLGWDQPITLQLLELPGAMNALEGVAMELDDCAFPLLRGIVRTSDPKEAFEGSDYALLIGAKPRTKGMERGDLLMENAAIFKTQGTAINEVANKGVKVGVVGNPANTNAMITSHFAPSIPANQITAMTRLDHTRGLAQLAAKIGCGPADIDRFAIWGNHSPTMYPDISHAQVARGATQGAVKDLIKDEKWVTDKFYPTVQKRGAEIIAARGASSAASAASAAIEHMRDWALGTNGQWTSMAVCSQGEYGVDKGIWYSYPVVCEGGSYSIVGNVPIDKSSAAYMETTRQELVGEKAAVASMLK